MSEFACEVVKVKIVPHPNADMIEIAQVGDYQSIVRKGQFQDGDLGVYIPEQAILPEWLLKSMGLWNETSCKGGLSGAAGNRVRAVKLRGIVSQGLMLTLGKPTGPDTFLINVEEDHVFYVEEGNDVAEFLGVVKYEPALPSHMRGKAVGVDLAITHNYDFDNLKRYPNLFTDGEKVVITEKIHGTLLQIAVVPTEHANERFYKGRVILTSKGLGKNGVILDHTDETNIYAQTAKKWGLFDKMLERYGDTADQVNKPIFLFGEVFGRTLSGKGVQDLTYTDAPLDFRAFDICIGNRGAEKFLHFNDFATECEVMSIPVVPVLFVGGFSKEEVLRHTDGPTLLTAISPRGAVVAVHIREGVVVKAFYERDENGIAPSKRKIAKSVSDAYLLRKGDVTEFG